MDDLRQQFTSEEENINLALDNLKQASERSDKTVIELAAIGTFLCNIYNGIENIIKQILKAKGKKIPNSKNSHKNLIEQAIEVGIVSEETSDKLFAYLGFRHLFIHGYAVKLDWNKMESLVHNIDSLWQEIKNQLADFINGI